MGPEMIAAIVASLGLAGGSVAGLWRIAQTLGRYEGSTAKVLEQLSNIVSDHETRLRSLERSDGLS